MTDRASYEAYRTGRTLQFQGSSARSVEFFEEAVKLDPKYAGAYAAKADALVAMARGRCTQLRLRRTPRSRM